MDMSLLKQAISIYTENFERILLLAFTILLPFLLFHGAISNYVFYLVADTPAQFYGDFSNLYLMMIFYLFVQIPFIQLTKSDQEGEEAVVKKSYISFLKYSSSVFLFGVVFITSVLLGMVLFIIPGIIILLFFYFTPYVAVYNERSVWKSMKTAFQVAKKNVMKLICLLLVIALIEGVLSSLLMQVVSLFSLNYFVILFPQLLLNMMLLPLFVIFTSLCYDKWAKDLYSTRLQNSNAFVGIESK